MPDSSLDDLLVREKISRRNFLKLVCAIGGATVLSPLIPFEKVFGGNVTNINNTSIVSRSDKVGPDGVSFLYPTKQGGFLWFMNSENPLDSHFEIGGGSSHDKLVRNIDDSWTANDHKKVKLDLNSFPHGIFLKCNKSPNLAA